MSYFIKLLKDFTHGSIQMINAKFSMKGVLEMEQFTFVKRGYDPEEVDKYITTLEQVIKSYKDKDNSIKNAIISAERTAADIIKNAQAEAETYKMQMGDQLVGMRGSLDRQRVSLQNLQDANTNAIRKCIQELERFDMSEMFSRIDEMDAAIAALQGLENMNKDRFMQSQSHSIDQRGMSRDVMMMDMGRREQAPEPRERDYGYPREAVRESSRDIMRTPASPAPYDMMRTRPASHPDSMPMRDSRDMMARGPYTEPMSEPMRDARDTNPGRMQPYPSHETMRDTGRDMMPGGDMMRPPVRDYAPESAREPQREIIRDNRRESRNEFGRDVRREYGRDMRSDTGRGRDDYRDGMGRLEREPMREMDRRYTPDADNYDDHDQNLLPPVASLM